MRPPGEWRGLMQARLCLCTCLAGSCASNAVVLQAVLHILHRHQTPVHGAACTLGSGLCTAGCSASDVEQPRCCHLKPKWIAATTHPCCAVCSPLCMGARFPHHACGMVQVRRDMPLSFSTSTQGTDRGGMAWMVVYLVVALRMVQGLPMVARFAAA